MRIAAAGLVALALLAVPTWRGDAAAKSRDAVVVELFTSQGCSSCPPADKFLGELAKRDDVIALTLPVDYWDYLGWKDTLATPAYSQRQRAYARRRRDRQVYTPQMVLDGMTHAVGSDRRLVNRKIDEYRKKHKDGWITVSLESTKDTITVKAGDRSQALEADKATIWLVLTTDKEVVPIKRGENTGRTINYFNVVRQMVPIGSWVGKPVTIALPKRDLMIDSYDACTVLIQADGAGPIIGAAQLARSEFNN